MQPLSQPPDTKEPGLTRWLFLLWKRVIDSINSDNFTGTEWTDLTDGGATTLHKHDHAAQDNLNSTSYTHLTAANHTDLTDGGDSALHYHATDRDSANFTGTNWTDLTDSGATTLHKHDHNGQDGKQGGTAAEYYHLTSAQNSLIPSGTPSAGQVPIASSGTASAWGTPPSGTVTSVSVVSANGMAGTVATETTTPAITLTTTISGLVKGNATAFSAATSGTDYSAGTSSLATGILKSTTTTGALTIAVAGDFPTLNQNTTGTASNVTGTVAIGNGGSGQTTAQLAINAFAGAVTSGSYLRGNGTNVVMNTIQAADVPTLNQNTTGTAANVTGTVAVANGGTGQTTAQAAIDALTAVSAATNEHVLTKDTTSGNAIWKAAAGGLANYVTNYPSIASATTTDIFGAAGATVGINNSTPVTTTDFADCTAAQVGSVKRVIPAENWTVTASANMTVNGFTSGDYVLSADSSYDVFAKTTSTFGITGDITDTITLTLSGSTGNPTTPVTTNARRRISGKRVSLEFEFLNVSTVGASGNLRVTGALPANSGNGYGICGTAGFTTTAPQLNIVSSIISVYESGTTGAVAMSAGTGKYLVGSVMYSG